MFFHFCFVPRLRVLSLRCWSCSLSFSPHSFAVTSKSMTPTIINGIDGVDTDWPHMCLLVNDNICGCVLVNNRVVLTAAHCVFGMWVSILVIFFHRDSPNQIITCVWSLFWYVKLPISIYGIVLWFKAVCWYDGVASNFFLFTLKNIYFMNP